MSGSTKLPLYGAALSLATAATAFFPSAVMAQEAVWPSTADTHPGEIVYSRDVPFGTATRRFDQGVASTVLADPSVLIGHSLLSGLSPLSDAEQASVSAPLSRVTGVVQGALNSGLAPLSASGTGTDFTRTESGATSTGNVIGQALGSLSSALGAMRDALGGGK